MIRISSPEQQLRQNRNLLLLIGGVGSVAGLLLWSATPFTLSSPKNKFDVSARYLSLLTTLGCGVATVVAGSQLERIKPLLKALDKAEQSEFLTQLASSQYQLETHWQQQALQPLFQSTSQLTSQLPVLGSDQLPSTSAVSEPGSNGSDAETVDCYKPLFHAVTLLQQQGMSDTKIVETVLGKRGRQFGEGKAILAELLQLGQEQGW